MHILCSFISLHASFRYIFMHFIRAYKMHTYAVYALGTLLMGLGGQAPIHWHGGTMTVTPGLLTFSHCYRVTVKVTVAVTVTAAMTIIVGGPRIRARRAQPHCHCHESQVWH